MILDTNRQTFTNIFKFFIYIFEFICRKYDKLVAKKNSYNEKVVLCQNLEGLYIR